MVNFDRPRFAYFVGGKRGRFNGKFNRGQQREDQTQSVRAVSCLPYPVVSVVYVKEHFRKWHCTDEMQLRAIIVDCFFLKRQQIAKKKVERNQAGFFSRHLNCANFRD